MCDRLSVLLVEGIRRLADYLLTVFRGHAHHGFGVAEADLHTSRNNTECDTECDECSHMR
jgi:hypothetical protein